jgi:hypothetical protein
VTDCSRHIACLACAVTLACAEVPTSKNVVSAPIDPLLPGPAGWQGHMADAANRAAREPSTPALRPLHGRMPLLHVSHALSSGSRSKEPGYELAVFEDGTLVYEGHRCVKIGGVVVARLDEDQLEDLRDLLATSCVGLERASDDEVCEDDVRGGSVRVTCSNGKEVLSGSDRCWRDEDRGKQVQALVSALLSRLGVAAWIGGQSERQACGAGSRDLAPHEIARTLRE